MLYIAVFNIFLIVFILTYAVLGHFYRNKISIENRIQQIGDFNKVNCDNTEKRSFSDRAFTPLYQALNQVFLKITPSYKLNLLNKKLEKSGLLKNTTTEKWLFIKNTLILIFSSLIGLLSYMISDSVLKALIMAVIIMIFSNVSFRFYLSRKIELRKKKILKDLPYTIDLIIVSVEAGLSFEGAMGRVISNITGELCDEFAKALKEVRMGIEYKTALKNIRERCDVKELSMLITSVIQADDLGVSLGRILRIEASNLREHRKQMAREKAMKAPVKLLFPLIFFIFPSIFIVILGPAVIRIINIFVKG